MSRNYNDLLRLTYEIEGLLLLQSQRADGDTVPAVDNMIAEKFIIPASALQTINGKEYVWLIEPSGFARRHQIQTSRLDGRILVESGLNSHDIIATAGLSSIREGQLVSMVQE